MGIEKLLVRVVVSEGCDGQRVGLVEPCVELLYGAGRCVLCHGSGPVKLRQERESFLDQWPSRGEVRLHCGDQGSASDGSDCFVVTPVASVKLSPQMRFATVHNVKGADLGRTDRPLTGGYLSQLLRLCDQFHN